MPFYANNLLVITRIVHSLKCSIFHRESFHASVTVSALNSIPVQLLPLWWVNNGAHLLTLVRSTTYIYKTNLNKFFTWSWRHLLVWFGSFQCLHALPKLGLGPCSSMSIIWSSRLAPQKLHTSRIPYMDLTRKVGLFWRFTKFDMGSPNLNDC